MAKVYDKDGKEYQVDHDIDVAEWVKAGYTIENTKESTQEFDREALKAEATELGITFGDKIGNKKLFELIEAKKAE